MRVTHVITRLIVGGAQENTVATVLGLNQISGFTVNLISGTSTGPEGSLAGEFRRLPFHLNYVSELVRPIHPWKDLLAFRKLTHTFCEQRPDIVHTHSGKAGFVGRWAASKASVPVIVHTIHGPSFGPFQGLGANYMFRKAERSAGRITTHFVAVADAMIEQYVAAGIGTRPQYTKILSGFSLDPFLNATNDPVLRKQYNIGTEDIVIGKIARLFKLKGHEDLFQIAPALVHLFPTIKFLLVGDGPWRNKFEQEAASLGLAKNIIFAGLVPPQEVAKLVGIMDMVVHLSKREGLPRALPQALAAAKPIVAYDCDGAREICLDDETGYLVPLGNLSELFARLSALAGNRELRNRLGKRGQEIVKEHFSVDRMVADIGALYSKLKPAHKIQL